MISRAHRFHGPNSLRRVYREGRVARGVFCSLKYLPTQRAGYRLAVVVSRKVNKSAVTRNRIRRRLYEAVRLVETDMKAPHDMALIVFNDSPADMPSTQLTDQIKGLLKEAGVI